jgi:hypothetical protein
MVKVIVVFISYLFLSALLMLESKLIVAACMDASVIRGIFRVRTCCVKVLYRRTGQSALSQRTQDYGFFKKKGKCLYDAVSQYFTLHSRLLFGFFLPYTDCVPTELVFCAALL